MVDAGYMPGEIAKFLNHEDNGVTMGTLMKYIQLYRRYFVPPLTAVRSTAARVKAREKQSRIKVDKRSIRFRKSLSMRPLRAARAAVAVGR